MASFVGGDADGGNTDLLTGLAFPGGTANKDVAILFWTMSTTSTPTSAPTGFTLIETYDANSGSQRNYLYYRICDGSESGGTVTLSLSTGATRMSAVLWVGRGFHASAPIDNFGKFDETVSGITHNPPAVTLNTANCGVLTFIGERMTTGTSDYTPPTGFSSNHVDSLTLAQGSGGTITAIASDNLTTARLAGSSVDPPVWTSASSTATANAVTYTLTLRVIDQGDVVNRRGWPPFWLPFAHPMPPPLQLQGDLTLPTLLALPEDATATDDLALIKSEHPDQAWPGLAAMFLQPSGASFQLRGSRATIYAPALVEDRFATDSLVVAAAVNVQGDTASATDLNTVTASFALTETATGTDALVVSAAVTFTDTAGALDATTPNTALVPLTETGTVVEAVTFANAIPVSETLTATDTQTQTVAAPLAETASTVEDVTISSEGDPALPDTATAMDVLLVSTVTFTVTESATGADLLTVDVPIALPEPITATDALTVAAAVTLEGDSATGLDALTVGIAITLTDATSATDDSLTAVAVFAMADTATYADDLAIAAAVDLADTAGAVEDDGAIAAEIPLTDEVVTEDDIPVTPDIVVILEETVTATEDIGADVGIDLEDTVAALEQMLALRQGIRGNAYPRPPRHVPGQAGRD